MSNNKCLAIKFKGSLKFIDLGLPSSTKWASRNVGAGHQEDAGLFFSWGNTTGHAAGAGYDFSQANYDESAGASLTGDIPASPTYDMAMANFGSNTKLPTKEQCEELVDNCTAEWVTINNIPGRRFTSNINGRSIFIPAAGNYNGTSHNNVGTNGFIWSSSLATSSNAYVFDFSNDYVNPHSNYGRRYGFTVRAVMQT